MRKQKSRIIALLLALSLVFGLVPITVTASGGTSYSEQFISATTSSPVALRVYVDNQPVQTNTEVVMDNDRAFVSLSEITEVVNGTFEWLVPNQLARIELGASFRVIFTGQPFYIEGEYESVGAALEIDGALYVPARALAEIFTSELEVDFDSYIPAVIIKFTSPIEMRSSAVNIQVTVDEEPVQFNAAPFILPPGITYLPLSEIMEAIGGNFEWETPYQTARIELNYDFLEVSANEYFPGEHQVRPIIMDGEMFVPGRNFVEVFGAAVDWESATGTTTLSFTTPVNLSIRTLPAPQNVSFDGTALTWDAVEGATGYRIRIDDWRGWGGDEIFGDIPVTTRITWQNIVRGDGFGIGSSSFADMLQLDRDTVNPLRFHVAALSGNPENARAEGLRGGFAYTVPSMPTPVFSISGRTVTITNNTPGAAYYIEVSGPVSHATLRFSSVFLDAPAVIAIELDDFIFSDDPWANPPVPAILPPSNYQVRLRAFGLTHDQTNPDDNTNILPPRVSPMSAAQIMVIPDTTTPPEITDPPGTTDPEPTPSPTPTPTPPPETSAEVEVNNPRAPGQVLGAVEDALEALEASEADENTVSLILPEDGDGIDINPATFDLLYEAGTYLSLTQNDITLILSPETIAEIRDMNIGGTISLNFTARESGDSFAAFDISMESGNALIGELENPIVAVVDLGGIDVDNIHRVIAVAEDGTRVGGSFDPETGLFSFEVGNLGEFTIEYVEDLTRLTISPNSPVILDLAGNAPTQVMDVLPVIANGRTLLPVRFLSNALGAGIGWAPETEYAPLTVTLTLGGETLTFAIGETAPGMDVPAQIIGGRTMVPLRFISEFFGATVNWDEETQSIEILR